MNRNAYQIAGSTAGRFSAIAQLGSLLQGFQFAPKENNGVYLQPSNVANSFHVFYPLGKDGNIGRILMSNGYSNILHYTDAGTNTGLKYVNAVTNGSFTAPGKSTYTTTIGDTISLTFTGTRISFYSYRSDLGGLWRFRIDGGSWFDVSVYRASATYVTETLATDLEYGEHTVEGEFMGDDPLNIPSGGAGTGRGYVCLHPATTGTDIVYKSFRYSDYKDFNIGAIADTSGFNTHFTDSSTATEFAWSVKKYGSVVVSDWIPEHGVVDATTLITQTLTADGNAVDIGTVLDGNRKFATKHNEIKLYQKFYGHCSNEISEELVEIEMTHTFTYKGVQVYFKTTALQDIHFTNSYSGMLSMVNQNFDNMIVNGTEYAATKTDGSDTIIPYTNNIRYAINTRKTGVDDEVKSVYGIEFITGKQNYKNIFLKHTDITTQKLYPTFKDGGSKMDAGTVTEWKFNYYLNMIDDAYNYVANRLL